MTHVNTCWQDIRTVELMAGYLPDGTVRNAIGGRKLRLFFKPGGLIFHPDLCFAVSDTKTFKTKCRKSFDGLA